MGKTVKNVHIGDAMFGSLHVQQFDVISTTTACCTCCSSRVCGGAELVQSMKAIWLIIIRSVFFSYNFIIDSI